MSSENYAFASSPQREAMLHFKEQTLLNRTQLGSWLSKLLAWSSDFSSIKWKQWYELCRDVIVEVKIPQSAYCLLWYLAHIRHSKHIFPSFYVFSIMVGGRLVFHRSIKELRNAVLVALALLCQPWLSSVWHHCKIIQYTCDCGLSTRCKFVKDESLWMPTQSVLSNKNIRRMQ